MSPVRQVARSRGVRAAAAVLLAGGVLASVGVAGAAQDVTVVAEGSGTSSHWSVTDVQVETGDTVTWDFAAPTHNVSSTDESAKDPRWAPYVYPGPTEYDIAPVGSASEYTFYKSGTYTFVCNLHPQQMVGTVTVTGEDLPIPTDPTPTPSPSPTPDPDPTPTPTPDPNPGPDPQPGPGGGGGGGGGGTPAPPDDHTQTPAPSPGADATRPQLSSIAARGLRRGARVRFTLSEPATVSIEFKRRGSRRVLRSVRVQARAGTRTIRVRSGKLKRGRYTVQLRARDAMGNRSSLGRDSFRIRR